MNDPRSGAQLLGTGSALGKTSSTIDAQASGGGAFGKVHWALLLLWLLFLFAVRRWENVIAPPMFAEDGSEFFLTARMHGWSSLLHDYSGYLHVPARFVAAAVTDFSATQLPAFYLGAALAQVFLTLWTIATLRLPNALRIAMCFGVVLVPHSGETMHVLLNAHWWLAIGLAAISLDGLARAVDGAPRASLWRDVPWLIGAGLAGPHLLMLMLLWCLRAWIGRSRIDFVLLGVAGAVGMAQLLVMAFIGESAHPPQAMELAGFERVLLRAFPSGLLWGPVLYDESPGWWASVAVALWVGLFAGAFGLHGGRRAFFLGSLCVSVAALLATEVRLGGGLGRVSPFDLGGRYFLLPCIGITWCLLLLLWNPGWTRLLGAAGLGLVCVCAVRNFNVEALDCSGWYQAAPAIDRGEAVDVVLPPQWHVRVPKRGG